MELRQRALQALCTRDPDDKVVQARALWRDAAALPIAPRSPVPTEDLPGRPARPELIHPAKVPRRSPFNAEGLAALLHAIAHVGSPAALRAVEILDVILRDEVGHVAIGNRWYLWCCERNALDPLALYPHLAARYMAPRLHPPFNIPARRLAGFGEDELAGLGVCAAEDEPAFAPRTG